jgi:hypothetical protein
VLRQTPGEATDEKGLVVALPGMETTQRPKMLEVQTGEHTTVAKVAVGKHTWQKTVDECFLFPSTNPHLSLE